MLVEKYNNFNVWKEEEKNVFIHLNINSDLFYDEMIEFFFSEEKILGYISNKTNIVFQAKHEQFVSLYKSLSIFIDDENLKIDIKDLKKELSNYINWETYTKDELLTLRRDKIGKVGEYILHNILADYFKFSCVLPKLSLKTNKNMSVYGIDVVFWSVENEMLLFGESKVSKNLDNGIRLINDSLSKYEHQIFEEYRTLLSNQLLNLNLPDSIKEYIGNAINFKKFITIANIKTIGIPIFIMNGNDINVEEILNKLNKLNKIQIQDLNIKYYIINLPIIDKNIFQSKIINYLRERYDYYESKCY